MRRYADGLTNCRNSGLGSFYQFGDDGRSENPMINCLKQITFKQSRFTGFTILPSGTRSGYFGPP